MNTTEQKRGILWILFSPIGRLEQPAFWKGFGILVGINFIGGLIPFVNLVAVLVMLWCGFAVYGKRLHDAGRTMFWHLIPWIVSVGGIWLIVMSNMDALEAGLSGGRVGRETAGNYLFAIQWLTSAFIFPWAIYTLIVGFLKSDPKNNRFGPSSSAEIAQNFD